MRTRLAQLHDSGATTTGQVVLWNNSTMQWEVGTASTSGSAIQLSLLDAKGDMIAASANDTPGKLTVGSNGQYLQADSTQTLGVKWATLTALTDPTTAAGDLIRRNAANTLLEPIPVGTNGHVLTLTSGVPGWAAATGGASGGYIRNRIINGNFRTNQRAYASAASLASGAYGFDRWKATTASTTLTYTSAPQGQALTINSGGSIAQVIERANIEAGDYVLSWTGTATGRVYNSGGSVPSYAASPVTVTLDGLADVVVEFTASGATKTLSLVQLEAGSTATAFERVSTEEEVAACQRYYVRYTGSQLMGTNHSTTVVIIRCVFPVEMRTTPTQTVGNGTGVTMSEIFTGTNRTGMTINANTAGLTSRQGVNHVTAGSGTLVTGGTCHCGSATAYVEYAAEL